MNFGPAVALPDCDKFQDMAGVIKRDETCKLISVISASIINSWNLLDVVTVSLNTGIGVGSIDGPRIDEMWLRKQ